MNGARALSIDTLDIATTAVQVDCVCRQFPQNVLALSDVSFEVTQGGFVAILGPSGCGKTTLLRLLCGLDRPTSGKITIAGKSPEYARKQGLFAMVFHERGLFHWMIVIENVRIPLEVS